MRKGEVPTDALNTHRLTLSDVPEQFASLLDPKAGVVKAIVEC
jgi:threonine dehydrogenase-like Zn-dependent dehydrogenase